MTTIIKPEQRTTKQQFEQAALNLRQSAASLAEIAAIIPNTPFWEWNHDSWSHLPLAFTRWLLLTLASRLEERAGIMRGDLP